jgi:hypothetical protein
VLEPKKDLRGSHSPEVLPWANDHEDLRRSIPKPPQVTRTPSPTKVRRWDKYSTNVLGGVGFVRSPEKNHGVRSHGSEGLMTLTNHVLTPSARSGKYLCLLIFVSARTSAASCSPRLDCARSEIVLGFFPRDCARREIVLPVFRREMHRLEVVRDGSM